MKYRIGLDIGIASIGWSVLETDEAGEPIRIADLGVRIYDVPEDPQTGDSLAAPRRQARSLRRLIRRRSHRVDRVKSLISLTFGDEIVAELEKNKPLDIVALRVKGLDNELTPYEISRLCVYFVKHRGFRSSKKAGSKDKDEGVLLTATSENRKKLIEGGYRSIGELLYKEYSGYTLRGDRVYLYRNKDGKYDNTFLREDLLAEITQILDKQIEKGIITRDFAQKYAEIFTSQRSFDEGPGKGSPYSGTFAIGLCTFERKNGYERAPKASYTAEYSIALQRLNNLMPVRRGEQLPLTVEQRGAVLAEIEKCKEIKFDKLRKILGYDKDDSVRFNLLSYSKDKTVKAVEGAVFVTMRNSYDIRKALSYHDNPTPELLDGVAEIISKYKSLDRQESELLKLDGTITNEEIEAIGKLDATKFVHLSLYALRKIQPYLYEGYKYSEACEKAGYNHSDFSGDKRKLLKGEDITELINEIGSPVVRRAFSQVIKVINAIVLKYGNPVGVNVEVARELSKTLDERRKIQKDNDSRHVENERLKERIRSDFGVEAKGLDIIKLRLYEQQRGKCAYSGEPIDISALFHDPTAYQVDHVIPYSRSFDDSFKNKVLVKTSENQNKKNMIPYEYFGLDEKRWAEYEARVGTFDFPYAKKQLLLRKSFTEEDESNWKDRNLKDTQYISRLVYNVIKNYLLYDESVQAKKKVRAVSGGITSYLRKMWGLTKVREDGDKHHALDAVVIAVVTDKYVNNISRYNKNKELFFGEKGVYIDYETGEVISREEFDARYGKKLNPPYGEFVDELKIRLMDECEETDLYGMVHKGIRQCYLDKLAEFGYNEEQLNAVKPIFVSRVPNRKAKGALHKATVYSNKYNNPEHGKVIVKKTPLKDLKLDKNGEIAGYFSLARQSDPALYEAIKERLKAFNNDGKKAFEAEFHKPTKSGELGPVVRSVRTEEKGSIGLTLEAKKGYVKNESMVRSDVFYKDGKYYFVPVYVKDIARGVIPNKAISAGKDYEDWDEMKEEDFLFSLYKNDLILVRMKNDISLVKPRTKEKYAGKSKEMLLYYKGVDSSTGNVSIIVHDNSYEGRPGLKTALSIKKYTVDVLGNVTEITKKEKRDTLGKKK